MAVSPSGKHLSHQRRIPRAVLEAFCGDLVRRKTSINAAKTFHELHEIVDDCASRLHGIGSLTAYDTAERIGAFLKLEPERVYLHAGTREGAKALGLGHKPWIVPADLPSTFAPLTAAEIEDCLCIYKTKLSAMDPCQVVTAIVIGLPRTTARTLRRDWQKSVCCRRGL